MELVKPKKVNLEPVITYELLVSLMEQASKKIMEEPNSAFLEELDKLYSFDLLVELISKVGSQRLLRSSLVTMMRWEAQKLFRELLLRNQGGGMSDYDHDDAAIEAELNRIEACLIIANDALEAAVKENAALREENWRLKAELAKKEKA